MMKIEAKQCAPGTVLGLPHERACGVTDRISAEYNTVRGDALCMARSDATHPAEHDRKTGDTPHCRRE